MSLATNDLVGFGRQADENDSYWMVSKSKYNRHCQFLLEVNPRKRVSLPMTGVHILRGSPHDGS